MTQIKARKQILKSGSCFCCYLKRGHIGQECHSSHKCPKSTSQHISISPRGQSNNINSNHCNSQQYNPTSAPWSAWTKSGLNPDAAVFVAQPTSVTICIGGALQTAQASVYNPHKPQLSLHVRAILDSGSQWSYITNQIINALSLSSAGAQTPSIAAFCSEGIWSSVMFALQWMWDRSGLELTMLSLPHMSHWWPSRFPCVPQPVIT